MKKHLLTLFLLIGLSLGSINAQWYLEYGTAPTERGFATAESPNGHYAAFGETRGFVVTAPNAPTQALLFQYTNTGQLEWMQSRDSICPISLKPLLALDNNDWLIVGANHCQPFTSIESDIYVERLNAQGGTVWSNTYGETNASDRPQDVIKTLDGGFAILGTSAAGSTSTLNILLVKVDANGNQQWIKTYNGSTQYTSGTDRPIQVNQLADGSFIVFGTYRNDFILLKTDSNGNRQWSETYEITDPNVDYLSSISAVKMLATNDGFVLFGEYHYDVMYDVDKYIFYNYPYLIKTDLDGQVLWEKDFFHKKGETRAHDILLTNEGDYLVLGRDEQVSIPGVLNIVNVEYFLSKYAPDGTVIWEKDYDDRVDRPTGSTRGHLFTDGNGYKALTRSSDIYNGKDLNLNKFENDGTLSWKKGTIVPSVGLELYNAIKTSDNGFLLTGSLQSPDFNDSTALQMFVAKMDSSGVIFTNYIDGQVFYDLDKDCVLDSSELLLEEWRVVAKGPIDFYDVTNEDGCYEMEVNTGKYNMQVSLPNPYWEQCPVDTVDLPLAYDSSSVNLPMQALVDCPYLEVGVGTWGLRRCFASDYYVWYCNSGTLPADDVYIEISFDDYLSVNSASIPITSQSGNLYRFDIGQLGINECGQFSVNVTVDCDSTFLGQTHCVEAHIFPDSICTIPDSLWSGATVRVDGSCQGDTLIFSIRNTGSGDMRNALPYIVIEDDVMILRAGQFNLPAGDSLIISIPSSGTTAAMITQQEPDHPVSNRPAIAIEGCGAVPGEPFSLGFIGQYAQNDGDPFNDISCVENVDSYDPNDKQATPKGRSSQHFIEANEPLQYNIRFQNTGTAPAITVVIRDTLPAELNPATLRPSSSSHNYQFELTPDGVAVFTFNNIQLPDSNSNEAASHGFIQFDIDQKADNLPGTVIQNEAAIYFDFNEPIITNVAFHEIAKPMTFSVRETTLCAGESFEGVVYHRDSTLIDTFSLATIDSIMINAITVHPIPLTEIERLSCDSLEAGIDTLRFTGQFCDSIVIQTTLFSESFTSELEETICEGESIQVGINNYTETGFYIDSLTSEEGCDSIVQLELHVQPTIHTIIDTILAQGTPFQGVIYTQDTTLTEQYLTVEGCDSIISINISIITTSVFDLPQNTKIIFSPNPLKEQTALSIHPAIQAPKLLRIYDLTGRLMKQQAFEASELDINMADLPKGMYLYELIVRKQTIHSGKLIVY